MIIFFIIEINLKLNTFSIKFLHRYYYKLVCHVDYVEFYKL